MLSVNVVHFTLRMFQNYFCKTLVILYCKVLSASGVTFFKLNIEKM